MNLDRRTLMLGGLVASTASLCFPRMSFAAAPTDRRFVFIIQRGASDGLHAVPPLGDPAYAALRGPWLEALQGGTKIDGLFSLHPALARTGQLITGGQGVAVHAIASVYRDRSHFDGQNVLETGGVHAFAESTGWMNRLIGLLPDGDNKALAVAADVPMALRGPQMVSTYAPSKLPETNDDLLTRVSRLYASDSQLHPLWESAMATHNMVSEVGGDSGGGGARADLGSVAAKLMRPADGARLVMIETEGWDTHSGQTGRQAASLRQLDAMIGQLVDGLGPAWADTVVLVATEFGRTAAINGTNGTDHGTASAALLLGGALRGGRVVADWPGLKPSALFQARDLKPTQSIEALISGAVAQHFGLDPERAARGLFPDQPDVKPMVV